MNTNNRKDNIYLNKIKKCILNKKYDQAIIYLQKYTPITTCIRTCMNLYAECLIGEEKYAEADELYGSFFPFVMIDEDDSLALKNKELIKRRLGYEFDADKINNSQYILTAAETDRDKYITDYDETHSKLYKHFMTNCDIETLERLIVTEYKLLRLTEAAVYYALCLRSGFDMKETIAQLIKNNVQALNFSNELNDRKENIYCVVTDESDNFTYTRDLCIVKALSVLGHEVYHLIYKRGNINNKINITDLIDFGERQDNITSIYIPVSNGTDACRIISEFILEFDRRNNTGTPYILFGAPDLLMQLNEDNKICRLLEMYYRHYEDVSVPKLHCLLLGNYYKAASYLYGYDVKAEFDKAPEYDFSIIIPVRNTVKYLSETIQTCLAQDYTGSYEVLISDNSDRGNIAVFELVSTINDSRIRYIQTPYFLTLAKSFEYAYLNARGKYLISLGADDGLMCNTLSVINKTYNLYPNYSIIQWNRAIYLWPDYVNKDNNRFNITYNLKKQINIIKYKTEPLIKKFALSDISFGYLPYLYMYACIKREYINKIYDITGKFGYGGSQDVYTGILNTFIEDEIVYINIPIFIGGISPASIGYKSELKAHAIEEYENKYHEVYSLYRYNNYYSASYRKNKMFFIPYGIIDLPYLEFIKVNHFKIKGIDYEDKSDLLYIFNKLIKCIPHNINDVSLVYKQLEIIAKNNGSDTYIEYMKLIKKKNRDNIICFIKKALTKFSITRVPLLFIKYNFIKLQNKNDGISFDNLLFFNKNPKTININCKDYNITGIKSASDCLYNIIKDDIEEFMSCNKND